MFKDCCSTVSASRSSPLAGRIPGADVQALRQFVGQSPWAVEAVQQQLARQVVDLLSDPIRRWLRHRPLKWLGWHHHVTLVTLAYAFLRFEQARLKKNFWCDLAASTEEAAATPD
jgi:SRSO17 transposase